MEEPTITNEAATSRFAGRAPLIIFLIAMIGGLMLICVFGYLLYCQSSGSCEDGSFVGIGNNDSAAPPEDMPTMIVPTVAGVSQSSRAEGIVAQIGASDTVSLTLDAPTLLQAGDENFAIQIGRTATNNQWDIDVATESIAVWLDGTVINYVLAIMDTEANRALMQSLERGDALTLSMESGRTLTFDFNTRTQVPITQPDIFRQNIPAITIVLVGQGNERIVVQGSYLPDLVAPSIDTAGNFEAPNVAGLGEPIQLGDLQLAVTAFDDRPQATGGFAYYLVDYQIQNNGSIPFDTTLLQMQLVDGVGNISVLSLDASQQGNYPALAPSLGVGQLAQATAGYQIPNGVNRASLGWVVTRLDTRESVEIRTSAPVLAGGSDPVQLVSLSNVSADLVADATSLLVQGSLFNGSEQVVSVNATDVSFTAGSSAFFIQSTNPQFPWVIGPGETFQFGLTVQKPINEPSAVFSIFDKGFEIGNYD